MSAVHELCFDDGVLAGSGRDGDFDAGVLFGEGSESGFEEGAAGVLVEEGRDERMEEVLHAATAAGPVAVVEVEALALEDECADTVLYAVSRVRGGCRGTNIPAP